jgi:hypothetical protein
MVTSLEGVTDWNRYDLGALFQPGPDAETLRATRRAGSYLLASEYQPSSGPVVPFTHRRYGGITRVCRQINYDIKHGVTNDQVLELLEAIKTDSTYLYLRNDVDCMDRLTEIEGLFIRTPRNVASPRFIVE